MSDMQTYRNEIDRIDAEIVRLFEERMAYSGKIGEFKASRGMPVFDGAREEDKIRTLREAVSDPENADEVERLYREIMAISRDRQNDLIQEALKE